MIEITLNKLAKRLNKSITDIAKETGLNRNTITALFHNKVDGIKFDTLEKICETYRIDINDIIGFQSEQSVTGENTIIPTHPYKQEGELQPFTCWGWMLITNRKPIHYFEHNLGRLSCYFKKDYGIAYWDRDLFNRSASSMYERYQDKENLDRLYADFLIHSDNLENLYQRVTEEQVMNYDVKELLGFFDSLWKFYEAFWHHSVFIDSFDAGVDQEKIKEISSKHNLSLDDVTMLTTPNEMTFDNERLFALLSIVKTLANKNVNQAFLKKFVDESPLIVKYMKDFDYYKSNYAHIKHLEKKEIIDEISKYLKDKKLFKKEYERLLHYPKSQNDAIKRVLRKYKLKSNPLWFFQKITFWREYRKKINLMGIHMLDMILASVEKKTGIPKKYLGFFKH